MVVAVPLELEPSPRAGLSIWQQPDKLRKYVIGVDTAGGLAKGDFACAVVIDGASCDVVATWRERDDPNVWGPKCAYLGWHYNEALLAIETHPSAHGYACVNRARAEGYTRLYRRSRQDRPSRPMSDSDGWSTDSVSKPQLINRVKLALQDADRDGVFPILCPHLLDELHEQHWNEKGEMESSEHDDLVIAFGIALMVRDQCWRAGELRVAEPVVNTEEARYWASREKRLAMPPRRARPKLRIG